MGELINNRRFLRGGGRMRVESIQLSDLRLRSAIDLSLFARLGVGERSGKSSILRPSSFAHRPRTSLPDASSARARKMPRLVVFTRAESATASRAPLCRNSGK
jgi:hypothetical protein